MAKKQIVEVAIWHDPINPASRPYVAGIGREDVQRNVTYSRNRLVTYHRAMWVFQALRRQWRHVAWRPFWAGIGIVASFPYRRGE